MGVKVRGKKAHSVSAAQVEQLVEDFYRIDFFPLVIGMTIRKSTISMGLLLGSQLATELKAFMSVTVRPLS